ncbi:MAG: hypothetical protein L3J41_14835 [Melioribacteraceae bacterium]|nr:hypothetical protein [Melioribacteraceae bacterium]
MARPKKEVDINLIEELAGLNCSFEEISHIMGVSVRTLHRSYGTVIKKGVETAKTSLKRKQFEVAMKGNPTMLIWLGKIILGQKDKIETEGKSELTIIRKIVELGKTKDSTSQKDASPNKKEFETDDKDEK